jgi:type I restriction enzyme, S subunit
MIADLNPYAECKESGAPWLGRVPRHWNVRRLRASITDCVNGVWGADPNGKDDLTCVRVADFDRVTLRVSLRKKTVRAIPLSARSRRLLQRSDLLLEKSGGGDLQPVGAVVAYDHDEPAVCSNFVARMPVASGYDTFFVNYLHFTLYANRVNLRSIKQTTGIQNLDGKAYLSELVAFPPLDEQMAIVRFLDWANGRLERAIRAKRKVIALLNEQKQAIIHRAVTRGLDPSVPHKPSGIPWLGDIPQHWEVRPLKGVCEVQSGITLGKDYAGQATSEYPYLRVANVQAGQVDLAVVKTIQVPKIEAMRCLLQEGDVLMTEGGDPDKLGRGCVWQGQIAPCLHQNHVFAVRPDRMRLEPSYLSALMGTRYARGYFESTAKQTTNLASTNKTKIGQFAVLLPSVQEQRTLMTALEKELLPVDEATSRLGDEVNLLREYRVRLIADVVTGKLDVREVAARLPDETPLETAENDADLSDESEATDEEASA